MKLSSTALAEINFVVLRDMEQQGQLDLEAIDLLDLAQTEVFFDLRINKKQIEETCKRMLPLSRGDRLTLMTL